MINIIFDYIDKHSEEYAEFLKDICSFEATAYDKDEINKMVDFIESFALGKNFSVTRTPFEKCGDFLTVDMNKGAEKGAFFLAHMDTVHKKGAFGSPAVTIDGDIMRGPGTVDCKGGIAIILLAMSALRENGYKKHTRLILTSDEEVSNTLGGEAEMRFFKESTAGFKCALNGETSAGDTAIVARKGILHEQIDITGISGHSGNAYFESASAILEAAKKIVEIESHSEKGGSTFNCSVISGGSAVNCVPDKCSFAVDIRCLTHEDMESAEKLIHRIADTSFVKGTSSTVKRTSSRAPMIKTEATETLFCEMRDLSKKYGLGDLTPRLAGGGSDSTYTQKAGLPSLCGLGGIGKFMHSDKEYIVISSVPKRAKLLAAFCAEAPFMR